MKYLLCILVSLGFVQFIYGQNTGATVFLDTASVASIEVEVETLFAQGKFADAADLSRAALKKVESTQGKNSEDYGYWQLNLGTCLQHAGNVMEAVPFIEAGTESARQYSGENSEDYIMALNNLGMLYLELGRSGEAMQALETTVSKAKKEMTAENPNLGVSINNLGLVYETVGRYDQALKLYEEALVLTEKAVGTNDVRYATRLHNIAAVYHKMKRFDVAIEYYDRSLKIMEQKVGKKHPRYQSFLINLCNLYQETHQYQKSQEILLESIKVIAETQGKMSVEYLNALVEIGTNYMDMSRFELAKGVLLEADSIAGKLLGKAEFSRNADNLLINEITVYEGLGDRQNTLAGYERMMNHLNREIRDNFDFLSEVEQRNALVQYNASLFKLFSYAWKNPGLLEPSGYNMILSLKELTLGSRKRLLESVAASPDPQIHETYQLWLRLNSRLAKQYALSIDKRSADFADMQAESETLERQLSAQSAIFREATSRTSWQDVQKSLKEDEAAVEFFHFKYFKPGSASSTDSILYVALLLRKQDAAPRLVYLFNLKEVGNLDAIRNLYAFGGPAGQPELNRLVWQPLSGYMTGIHTIYYAPSGILHRVNLAAIPISEKETVSDRFQLFALGNTRELTLFHQNTGYEDAGAAVFGGIVYQEEETTAPAPENNGQVSDQSSASTLGDGYRSMRNNSWPFLEWTSREASDIKAQLEKAGMRVEVHKGLDATEEVFKNIGKNGPSPRVLHVATHGYFFPDTDTSAVTGFRSSLQPLIRSGLILANANPAWKGEPSPPDREDGILTAYEISQMNLRNTELVVLSACDTGLGELQGNEGLYGLQRAFKLAGAKYILMSLWKVSDQSTYEFMTAFYREWLENKKDIPGAFQAAQNRMRVSYNKPFNPFLWAGFILVQ